MKNNPWPPCLIPAALPPMAATPFDHVVLSGLFGDSEAAAAFVADAELQAIIDFEAAPARTEAPAMASCT